jgi:hypothetical protein
MYIVISKPKRMSLAVGVSHFMLISSVCMPQGAVGRTASPSASTERECALWGAGVHHEFMDSGLMIFMRWGGAARLLPQSD